MSIQPPPEAGYVLYVHPFGHPENDVLPLGLVALMNALPGPKLGAYPHELTPELLLGARVLLMDVHWYHGLWGARSVSRAVRSVAPELTIVVGGYTASAMAESLVQDEVADFVVVGDAERPLPELLRRLATGSDIRDVPNLVGRGFRTPRSYVLTTQDYAHCDSQTIDWFPSLWANVAKAHSIRPIVTKHPAVPIYKGCSPPREGASRYCVGCWGQPQIQKQLAGRSLVHRSAIEVCSDLARLSADPTFKRIHLFDDPIAMLGEAYAAELFCNRYDLDLYMEPHCFFSSSLLEKIVSAFNHVELMFYHHDLAKRLAQRDAEAVRFLQYANELNVKTSVCSFEPEVLDLRDTAREFGVEVLRNEDEVLELPNPFATGSVEAHGYRRFLARSQSFAVLKLIADVAPSYLDVAGVQLGVCIDSEGLMKGVSLPVGVRRRPTQQNPIYRDVMSGANRMALVFYAAPFATVEPQRRVAIERIPQSALLASPERISAVNYTLHGRVGLEMDLRFHCVRAGLLKGVAINFVSDKPGAMRDLPYDTLYKLCVPLVAPCAVRAGETARVRLRNAPADESPWALQAELGG